MPRLNGGGPDPIDVAIGRRVAERRQKLGHTQSTLAKALGLTFQQVQKYESGKNRISGSKLYRTAGFLGVGVDYFYRDLPDPKQLADLASLEDRLRALKAGEVGKTASFANSVVHPSVLKALCALVDGDTWAEFGEYVGTTVVRKVK